MTSISVSSPMTSKSTRGRLYLAVAASASPPLERYSSDDDPTGWKAMREFIGLAKDAGASTASVDHDAIIYRR
jgi:hypothetical protein